MNIMLSLLLSLVTAAGLIAIHEFGHMLFGYIHGIPINKMALRVYYKGNTRNLLDSMVFFALLDDDDQRISPASQQKYGEMLEKLIPCERRQFWFFAGGHAFELIFILGITALSLISSRLVEQTALTIQLALGMALAYLLMELHSGIKSPGFVGGDFTAQWAISPTKTITFYVIYFAGLAGAWFLLRQ